MSTQAERDRWMAEVAAKHPDVPRSVMEAAIKMYTASPKQFKKELADCQNKVDDNLKRCGVTKDADGYYTLNSMEVIKQGTPEYAAVMATKFSSNASKQDDASADQPDEQPQLPQGQCAGADAGNGFRVTGCSDSPA